MDCTFCLDCVHACPHHNVGVLARPPGSDLLHAASGSEVGSIGKRPDLAVLIVILVFGAFVNAAGMVAPILAWRDRLESLVRPASPLLVTSLLYFFGLLVLPLVAVGWRGRSEPAMGPAHRQLVRGRGTIFLCVSPHRLRHVACALQFSFVDELRHSSSRGAAFRDRPRLVDLWTASLGGRLLPPRGGLVTEARSRLP